MPAGYAVVWLALVTASARLLATRADLDVLVLRQPGTLYVSLPGGDVANFYTVQALNRTSRPATFAIDVLEPRGAVATPLGPLGSVGPYALQDGRFLIRVPRTHSGGTEHAGSHPGSSRARTGPDRRDLFPQSAWRR